MAVSGGPVQSLCDEATCSICLEYFKDPVTIPECGHNFCRSCLVQCWGKLEAEAFCPQCRITVQPRSLISNWQLANVVEIAKKLSLPLQEGKVCEKHQETLKLFCKVHEAPICVVCDRSKEHENHKVIPLEEASEEYKRLICSRLETVRREREKMLAYREDLEKQSQDLLKLTKTEKQGTEEKFRQLRQFLEAKEKHLLQEIEEVELEVARRRDEQLARLSRELSSLERIIQEMEEKRQKPASELLQDVRSTLQKYEKRERLEAPCAFPPQLNERLSKLCDINSMLEDVMKQFKSNEKWLRGFYSGHFIGPKLDSLLFRQQLQKENVTLDPDTAHPRLILSEDRKSVRWGDKKQALPDNPERFSDWPSVLGREGFKAGRHFWDVTVGSEGEWAVGVARKSLRRKDDFLMRIINTFCELSYEEGIWAVGKLRGKYRACTSPDSSPLSLSEEPRRIRVTLDCEAGEMSFSGADSGAELYTFSGASFSGETFLPFFYLRGDKIHLRIS
ncbi:finger RFP-like [Podarcis lilfordi]|uniref:Finger RFP-like n=1 Tax=Podarcis lilfordi TaxID=74358 RepID=A0AA35JZC2_9SAUR|nr:finger RFP-like [Podarcis lilfordi]